MGTASSVDKFMPLTGPSVGASPDTAGRQPGRSGAVGVRRRVRHAHLDDPPPGRVARIPRPGGRCGAPGGPRNRGPVTTLLAGLSLAEMSPAMTVEGGTTAAGFAAYLHRILVPALRPRQTVVVGDVGRTSPSGCTS